MNIKSLKLYCLLIIIMSIIISCSKDNDEVISLEKENTFITSFSENDDLLSNTKWENVDSIGIFSHGILYKFINFSGICKNAAFKGYFIPDNEYIAIYPYNKNAKINNSSVELDFPSQQDGTENGSIFTIGHTKRASIIFSQIFPTITFELDSKSISVNSIEVYGNNNENITGKVIITYNEDGTFDAPKLSSIDDGTEVNHCILIKNKDNSPIGLNNRITFIMPYGTYSNGITLKFKDEENNIIGNISSEIPLSIDSNQKFEPFGNSPIIINPNYVINNGNHNGFEEGDSKVKPSTSGNHEGFNEGDGNKQ